MLQGYYAILDVKGTLTDLDTLLGRAEILLRGEPCCLQLRAKSFETPQWMESAKRLQAVCRARNVFFCVNDRLDVGIALDVDGVHLGQEDQTLFQALNLRGSKARPFIGISTHDLTQAQTAVAGGADYIGFGPIFPTQSKLKAGPACGVSALSRVVSTVTIPVVAIGGITLENVKDVVRAGASAAAVIAAVETASDPSAMGRAIGERFRPSPLKRT